MLSSVKNRDKVSSPVIAKMENDKRGSKIPQTINLINNAECYSQTDKVQSLCILVSHMSVHLMSDKICLRSSNTTNTLKQILTTMRVQQTNVSIAFPKLNKINK